MSTTAIHRRSGRRLLGALASLILVGCSDPPAAPPVPQPHPLAGTWDVVAIFDEFSFEIHSLSEVPECHPEWGPYCYIVRPTAPDSLVGTLVIRDSSGSVPFSQYGTDYFFPTTGTFTGSFCDEPDYRRPDGCAVRGPRTTLTYEDRGTTVLTPEAPEGERLRGGVDGPGAPYGYRNIHWQASRISENEFSGRLDWVLTVWRNAPTYHGNFVARRRR